MNEDPGQTALDLAAVDTVRMPDEPISATHGRAATVKPYYEDEQVALYLGDMREIIPELGLTAGLIVADPPYGETSLKWDRWPDAWVQTATEASKSMWCFGSMRMFLEQRDEFAGWKLSHDVVWEKNTGTGFQTDRFRRIHEHALHWYRGKWGGVYHEGQRHVPPGGTRGRVKIGETVRHYRSSRGQHLGEIGDEGWTDDGTRLITSVLKARNLHQNGSIHPTEKPVMLLMPLIKYGCPEGGLVLDPFAGSGATLEAARLSGRRAIDIEISEAYCEAAARRLSQQIIGAAL